ncbi:adenylate kinase [Micromonospora aurantiaca ATCC 27029]|nr:adenylate kinase [Micromonospora aurantiaca ATCC 27029]
MRLAVLGPPGSDRKTIASTIAARLGVPCISLADIVQAEIRASTPAALQALRHMNAGELVPEPVLLSMIRNRLTQPDVAAGFVLDGTPNQAITAVALDTLLSDLGAPIDRAIDLVLPRRRGSAPPGRPPHLPRLRPNLAHRERRPHTPQHLRPLRRRTGPTPRRHPRTHHRRPAVLPTRCGNYPQPLQLSRQAVLRRRHPHTRGDHYQGSRMTPSARPPANAEPPMTHQQSELSGSAEEVTVRGRPKALVTWPVPTFTDRSECSSEIRRCVAGLPTSTDTAPAPATLTSSSPRPIGTALVAIGSRRLRLRTFAAVSSAPFSRTASSPAGRSASPGVRSVGSYSPSTGAASATSTCPRSAGRLGSRGVPAVRARFCPLPAGS